MVPLAVVGVLFAGCSSSDADFRSDVEESREEDHQIEMAIGETSVIVSHVVPVDGYTYLNASESEIRGAIDRLGLIEAGAGEDLFEAVSLHGVVADDPSQNTAGRSDGGFEVGYLNLVQFSNAVPYGIDEQLTTGLYGESPVDRLDIAGISVFVFENPGMPDSQYTYGWLEHGVQGTIDGADREPLERWLTAYLGTPKLSEHETAELNARLADIPGFAYSDLDFADAGETVAPLGDIAHSTHKVADRSGKLGTLVLAEIDDTAPLVQMMADLGINLAGEIEVSEQRVRTLDGTTDGIDAYGFIWTKSGISGSLGTNADDLDRAKRFLEAFLES